MSTSIPRPDNPGRVTGGCLCDAIRYTLDFTQEGSWPPEGSNCQCTLCRKSSGALIAHALFLPVALITPPLDASHHSTLRMYKSGEKSSRSFCVTCGSSLAWQSEAMPDKFILFNGTIDEEFLNGKRKEGTEKQTKYGREFERENEGWGRELAVANLGNLYWQNKIVGRTDCDIGGPKFLQDLEDAPLPKDRW